MFPLPLQKGTRRGAPSTLQHLNIQAGPMTGKSLDQVFTRAKEPPSRIPRVVGGKASSLGPSPAKLQQLPIGEIPNPNRSNKFESDSESEDTLLGISREPTLTEHHSSTPDTTIDDGINIECLLQSFQGGMLAALLPEFDRWAQQHLKSYIARVVGREEDEQVQLRQRNEYLQAEVKSLGTNLLKEKGVGEELLWSNKRCEAELMVFEERASGPCC